MMKKLIGVTAAILALTGCVAVPVYDNGPAYGSQYGPPAATFSFGYYYDGHSHGNQQGYSHGPRYRHGR